MYTTQIQISKHHKANSEMQYTASHHSQLHTHNFRQNKILKRICNPTIKQIKPKDIPSLNPIKLQIKSSNKHTWKCQVSVTTPVGTPQSTYDQLVSLGTKKSSLAPWKTFFSSIIAGGYIGLGGLLLVTVGGSCPGLMEANPGIQKILCGIFGLPLSLLLILLSGMELFTGNTMLLAAAYLEGKTTINGVFKNWFYSYFGNFIGCLGFIMILNYSGILNVGNAVKLATAKSSLTFIQAFCRGIVANWVVCLSVWLATQATTLPGKVLGITIPISGFVAMGFEHSIANMFLIPYGIISGAKITYTQFICQNLIPVTLGNIVGGVCLVSCVGSIMYGKLGNGK